MLQEIKFKLSVYLPNVAEEESENSCTAVSLKEVTFPSQCNDVIRLSFTQGGVNWRKRVTMQVENICSFIPVTGGDEHKHTGTVSWTRSLSLLLSTLQPVGAENIWYVFCLGKTTPENLLGRMSCGMAGSSDLKPTSSGLEVANMKTHIWGQMHKSLDWWLKRCVHTKPETCICIHIDINGWGHSLKTLVWTQKTQVCAISYQAQHRRERQTQLHWLLVGLQTGAHHST